MAEIQRTLTDLRPNTRYIVRARTINGFGVKSEWSEALDFTTGTDTSIPKPPENLEAAFNNSDLLMSWTAPTHNTDWTPLIDFSHYEVTIIPSPATDPVSFSHDTKELVYVFPYQLNATIWDEVQGSVTVEVRAVDTAGNKSDPTTAIAIASGVLTESGVSVGDLSGLGVVFDSDYNAGTILYATEDNTPEPKTLSQLKTLLSLTNEDIQDLVGAMVSGNTETNIAVTYDDTNGKLNFVVSGAGSQNLWQTITSDSGSTVASSTTDTLTVSGGNGIDTSISGDTLTISFDVTELSDGSIPLSKLADDVATQTELDAKLDEDVIVDEDDMASDSDLLIPTQQSVKAYVDSASQWELSGGIMIPKSSAVKTIELIPDNYTLTAEGTPGLLWDNTVVLDFANAIAPPALSYTSTLEFSQAANLFGGGYLFGGSPTIKNVSGEPNDIAGFYIVLGTPTYQADNATITLGFAATQLIQPTFNTINSGTLNVATYNGLYAAGTVAAGVAVTEYNVLGTVVNPSKVGTVTNLYGLTIHGMNGATTTNVGLRIAGSTTAALWLGYSSAGTTVAGGIVFGSGRDVNLYRSAANVLKTDDAFDANSLRIAGTPITATATELNYSSGVTSSIQTQIDSQVPRPSILTESTTSRTLALTDAWDYIRLTNGTSCNITVPDNTDVAFPVGTKIYLRSAGAGTYTIVEDTAVTVNPPVGGTLVLQSDAYLIKVDTDEWDLVGDTVPV